MAITLLELLIYSGGVGFKNTYFLTAVVAAAVLVIVAVFYKDKAEKNTEASKPAKKQRGKAWDDFEYEDLSRKPAYYAVIIALAVYSLTSAGPISVSHYKDIGFDGGFIAIILSISSIGLAVTKILAGMLYDQCVSSYDGEKASFCYGNSSGISNVPLHYIKIGELELFGFPSEVYCYFGRDVKAKCGNDKRIVISYCNGLFGYIPTRELFNVPPA